MTDASNARDQAPQTLTDRKSARVALDAQVFLRRSGQNSYRAYVFDVSQHGCRVEFVQRTGLNETVWVKFEKLEPLEARVCWVQGSSAGLEFQNPVHYAVFGVLVERLAKSDPP